MATETIQLDTDNIYCRVMEYFGPLNSNTKNLHFIVNEKYIFESSTTEVRDEWIAQIVKRNNYIDKSKKASNQNDPDTCTILNKTQFERITSLGILKHSLYVKCKVSKSKEICIIYTNPNSIHQNKIYLI